MQTVKITLTNSETHRVIINPQQDLETELRSGMDNGDIWKLDKATEEGTIYVNMSHVCTAEPVEDDEPMPVGVW